MIVHLANTGSSEALAGTITLGGTSMYNVKCRYTMEVNQKRLKGEDDGIPGHFEYQPPFWDHSLLALLNGEAERRRLRRPFEKVTEIREDNGEVFGAEYLTQQLERNKTVGQNKDTWMCNCILCHPLLSNSDSSNNETHSDKVEMEVEVVKQQKQKKTPKSAETHLIYIQPAVLNATNAHTPQQYTYCRPPPFGYVNYPVYHPPWVSQPPPLWCCEKFKIYELRKRQGLACMGRPPHDTRCSRRVYHKSTLV